jgi:hypothetical protein
VAVPVPGPSTESLVPQLGYQVPVANIEEERQEMAELEDHQAFKRSEVRKLLTKQINPSMRFIRSKKGRRLEGPFVVAQNVNEEVFDESVQLAQLLSEVC